MNFRTKLIDVIFAAALLLALITTSAYASMLSAGNMDVTGGGSWVIPPSGILIDGRDVILPPNTGNISVDSATFPDDAFRAYVSANTDTDGDGVLSKAERAAVTELSIYSSTPVTDYTGIGHFPNLKILRCQDTASGIILDPGSNALLEELYCDFTGLADLDLSGNPALRILSILDTKISSVDLSGCTELEFLMVGGGHLTSLDVSANEKLATLACADVTIPGITFGNNAALTVLELNDSDLEIFPDLSLFPELEELRCEGCGIAGLDISGNPKLSLLTCTGNNFDTLDISDCPILVDLVKNGESMDYVDGNGVPYAREYYSFTYDHAFMVADIDLRFVTEKAPVITSQPGSVSVRTGAKANFTVKATGAASYQWQKSADKGATWSAFTATVTAKTANLKFNASASNAKYLYRCAVSNSADTVYSDAVSLTLTDVKPAITAQPESVSVKSGAKASFMVTAAYAESYQWQKSADNGKTWSAFTATVTAKTANMKFNASASNARYLYKCAVTNAAGTVYSEAVSLTLTDAKPAVTGQPVSVSVKAGSKVSFTVTATGAESYQWQKSADNGKTWTAFTATVTAKTANMKFNVSASNAKNLYRCAVMNANGTVYSNAAGITLI